MRIGPPSPPTPPRLLAARALAVLSAGTGSRELDAVTAHRVETLRDQVERGEYRVDPNRLAASVYGAIGAGGL